jgi:serine/threonine-protein phosphatase 5
MCPRDADAANKLRECEKEVKRIAFETAIAGEAERAVSETIDLSAIGVEPNVVGDACAHYSWCCSGRS